MNKFKMEKLKELSYQLLLKNRREKDGYQYTVPSPSSFPYQWFWDSCFHAIVLSHFDTDAAKKELFSLLSHQFENGMIPHMIYWGKKDIYRIDWGKKDTSAITQPPLIAQAALAIFKKDGDIEFLKKIFSGLYRFYIYLLKERDPHHNSLAGIINPDESGEDNSPRFDIPLGLPVRQTMEKGTQKRRELFEKNRLCHFDVPFCMKNFFWVEDVPFNAFLIENIRALSEISKVLGKKDEAFYFQEQSILITRAMRDRMADDYLYWSTYGEDHKKILIKTWAIFAPLYAKILSQEEAEQLVKNHLLNKEEFATPFPCPTVSQGEPSYDPKGYWRGPVWIATNWFIFKGLSRYNFHDTAGWIKEKTIALIEKSGFREQFHPETGKGLGAKNFTWGTLIVDMTEDKPI